MHPSHRNAPPSTLPGVWKFVLSAMVLCAVPAVVSGQCTNNNTAIAGGAITPTCPGTTTVSCVRGGQYALVNVVSGYVYTFSLCGATFDTQLTLYANSGGGALGFNDDYCGTASQLTWQASFTGPLRVLVDRYNCASNTVCAPLVITCAEPGPAPPEDCLGAVTICSDDVLSSNAANTGMVIDLTNANRGCLDPERQGTWYVFTPSEGGNLGFNLNVSGASVYDWAIWGPFAVGTDLSTVCPPPGPPIRCDATSAGGTFASTGAYTKGMGHATFSPPQFAPPTLCATCSSPPTPSTSCPYTAPRRCGWVPGLQVQVGEMYLMYIDNWYRTGLAFELDWMQGPGFASLACTVLPVELFHFQAMPRRDHVDVQWSTVSEAGFAHHVVERSMDGEHFLPLAHVPGAPHAGERYDHLWTDDAPLPGVSYYRLRSLDHLGVEHLSDRVAVTYRNRDDAFLVVVPNPAGEQVELRFDLPEEMPVTCALQDASGRHVRILYLALPGGPQRATLSLEGLSAGLYTVELRRTEGQTLGHAKLLKR